MPGTSRGKGANTLNAARKPVLVLPCLSSHVNVSGKAAFISIYPCISMQSILGIFGFKTNTIISATRTVNLAKKNRKQEKGQIGSREETERGGEEPKHTL